MSKQKRKPGTSTGGFPHGDMSYGGDFYSQTQAAAGLGSTHHSEADQHRTQSVPSPGTATRTLSIRDVETQLTMLYSLCEARFDKLEKKIEETSSAMSRESHTVQSGQTDVSGSQRSWIPFFGGSKCSNCETLKKQLEVKESENKRLASQINAEIRKMQGNLGQSSSDDCKQAFMLFFANAVDRIVKKCNLKEPENETKRQMMEHVCNLFMGVFEQVKQLLQGLMQQNLDAALFNPMPTDGSSHKQEYNDFIRAYGRLLSACNLAGQSPIKPDMIQGNAQLLQNEEFVTECISLSWKLLTTVPPLLPYCPNGILFNEEMHEDFPEKCGGITPGQPLLYSKPVLTNCTGQVYVRGSVRTEDKAVKK